ncbi:hypothetical protein HMPREF0663_11160 [Hoylesella oralis ATCC 33269]|uniref:Uncharacterized protein n=1 Tax=Hoylesella oralis ATCC 33269 TaxID=873533 RepID=E7RPQ9_9BACT|nr:hypothetical protein HMPREF0663_11160 [Hoylesella oralis ATCC 33269]
MFSYTQVTEIEDVNSPAFIILYSMLIRYHSPAIKHYCYIHTFTFSKFLSSYYHNK